MKLAVLCSGGVDSAVVVHRLVEEGHDLTLFYIRIGMDNGEGDCSAEEDIEMCQAIAHHYGLPLEVVSLHQEYWDNVMEYALRTVRAGLTPNPDMMCNKMIKFGFFEERWGHCFDLTATGHYATTDFVGDKKYLCTAADRVKDQTDFLAQISYNQLKHLIFPIGSLPKEEVRRIALEAKLPNAYRKDSQGICFLGKINYNDFLRKFLGEQEGKVIDIETNRIVGTHKGFWFHTIGQRKGLGLSGGPWFVVKKNVRKNVVFVAHGWDTQLQYGHVFRLADFHAITEPLPIGEGDAPMEISFKVRHVDHFMDGTIERDGEGYIVRSPQPIQGIAPGQFGCIYDREKTICWGSGEISV